MWRSRSGRKGERTNGSRLHRSIGCRPADYRGMVVTDDRLDGLAGIVTLDDLLVLIGDELAGLGNLFDQERSKERVNRH